MDKAEHLSAASWGSEPQEKVLGGTELGGDRSGYKVALKSEM